MNQQTQSNMSVKFQICSLLVLLFLLTLAEGKSRSRSSSSSTKYSSGYRYRGSSSSGGSLSPGSAIVICVIIAFLVVFVCIYCLCCKKRGEKSQDSQIEGMNLSNVQHTDGPSNPMVYPPNQFIGSPVAQTYADPSYPISPFIPPQTQVTNIQQTPPYPQSNTPFITPQKTQGTKMQQTTENPSYPQAKTPFIMPQKTQGTNMQQTSENPSYPQSNTPFITPQTQGSNVQHTAEQPSYSYSYLPQGGNNDIPEIPPPAYQDFDPPMYAPVNQTPSKPGPPY